MEEQNTVYKAEDGKTEHLFKVVVLGDIGTGKSAILKRYVDDIFSIHYRSTTGVDWFLKQLNIDEKNVVHLQLWDLAGEERFGVMTQVYYSEAKAAVIVIDPTRLATLEAAKKITEEEVIEELGGLPGKECHCATLVLRTLRQAIRKFEQSKSDY